MNLGRHIVLGAIAFIVAVLVRAWAVPSYNVVVITLDTTRADRLSPYGFMDVSLPHLERLAREGVVFDQATTVAPLTLPAHSSLFTGLLPPRHGVHDNADKPLADTATTLAEMLKTRGFRTGAFVSSVVLDPDRGLTQGFEQYSGVKPGDRTGPEGRQRRADAVVHDALEWLDGVERSPFFMWTHFYDAHRPYDPPEPFATTYGHNLYVGEIAYVDSQIGRLLEALERRRLLDRTILIVAGDHGESLGDRGERDHGVFIYENVLRVPLIVRAPRTAPRRVGDVVRLTDIMPTVLDLLGLRPAPDVDGVSLSTLLHRGTQTVELEAYGESLYPQRMGWSALRSLRTGRYKYIDAPRPELFDLDRDPFEERNIYETRKDLAALMRARASAIASGGRAFGPGDHPRDQSPVDPDIRARLAALGYITNDRVTLAPNQTGLPDPKDMIHLLNPDRR